MRYTHAQGPPVRYGSTPFLCPCLLRAANNSGRLRFSFGLFDIRNHNGHVKGLQRFDFEEVILPHKDYKIEIHAQLNEHLKCLVIEESVEIGHGKVRLVGVLVVVLYLGFACHCSSSVASITTSSIFFATTSFTSAASPSSSMLFSKHFS
jgi:hypothetical protein